MSGGNVRVGYHPPRHTIGKTLIGHHQLVEGVKLTATRGHDECLFV